MNKIYSATCKTLIFKNLLIMRGNENHMTLRGFRVVFKFFTHLKAIHAGHFNVEQNHIWLKENCFLNGLSTIIATNYLTKVAKRLRHYHQTSRLIIHYKHFIMWIFMMRKKHIHRLCK